MHSKTMKSINKRRHWKREKQHQVYMIRLWLFKVSVLSMKIQATFYIEDKNQTPQRQQRTLSLSSVEPPKNIIKFVSHDKFN